MMVPSVQAGKGGDTSVAEGGKLGPYPAYKNSGVAGLGEIPAHWETRMLKHFAIFKLALAFLTLTKGIRLKIIPFFKVGDMGTAGNTREMFNGSIQYPGQPHVGCGSCISARHNCVCESWGSAIANRRRILVRPSCIDNNMMGFIPHSCDPKWAIFWLSRLDMRELANPGAVPSVNESQMSDTPGGRPARFGATRHRLVPR